mmetsp:Transcript_36146/g.93275  ORF Transcript_36146/g.93275 Transcript_36146/m.93275 type:complete len:210 (+) Transcript_36146:1111-1740(+)
MCTCTACRSAASGVAREGRRPHSKPRATELPIHFCGTGARVQATVSLASLVAHSWSTSSLTSYGLMSFTNSACPGSGGDWCTSVKCMSISAAFIRCSITRSAFFTTAPSLPVTPRSNSGSIEASAGGRPSKPSRRKPSQLEFVMPSTTLWRNAATRDLPCQPACAVRCPIFTSTRRRVVQPSQRLRMTSRSRGRASEPLPAFGQASTPA